MAAMGGRMPTELDVFSEMDRTEPDPKVPSWDGANGSVGLESYGRLARAYASTLEDNKQVLAAPRLWQNLRGEAKQHVFKTDMAALRAENGVEVLLAALQTAYPEGPLRKLPRLYRALFKEVSYRAGDPVMPVMLQLERAKANLEAADAATRVSSGILGFFLLDVVGFTEQEEAHIFGLTGFSMEYQKLKAVIYELYSSGTHDPESVKRRRAGEHRTATADRTRQAGPSTWRRWGAAAAHWADGEELDEEAWYDDGAEEEQEDDPEANEAEAWVTEAAEVATQAEDALVSLRDECAANPDIHVEQKAGEVTQATAAVAEAYLNLREAKSHINAVAKTRGHYPPPPVPPDHRGRGRSPTFKGGRKGKSKSRDRQPQEIIQLKKANTRCLTCGRLGHWRGDPECPMKGSQPPKGKSKGKKAGKGLLALMGVALVTGCLFATRATIDEYPYQHSRTEGQEGAVPRPADSYQQRAFRRLDGAAERDEGGQGGAVPRLADSPRNESRAFPTMGTLDVSAASALWSAGEYPMTIVDSGCTSAVAGRGWLEALQVQHAGWHMRPWVEERREVFHGLGGVRHVSERRWHFAAGIYRKHRAISYAEIAGDMPGLMSKIDLGNLGFVWRARSGIVDFEELGLTNLLLPESPAGCLLLDVLDFDPHTVASDNLFEAFRPKEDDARSIALVASEGAVAAGRFEVLRQAREERDANPDDDRDIVRRALPSTTRRAIVKSVKELRKCLLAVSDPGHTFVWELFAGTFVVTRVSVDGGHVAGQPLELELGIDLGNPDTEAQVLAAIDEFKPWLVGAGFPCDPWSSLQNFNIARGFGERVYAKREYHMRFLWLIKRVFEKQLREGRLALGENPWQSAAWAQEPIRALLSAGFVLVKAQQCSWGLRDWWQHFLHREPALLRKDTGFLVPEGSALETYMHMMCTHDHDHASVMGGDTKASGHYPTALARDMHTAALQDLLQQSPALGHIIEPLAADTPAAPLRGVQAAEVADAMYLRRDNVEVFKLGVEGELPAMPGYFARRVAVLYDAAGGLVDLVDWLTG